MYVCMYVCMYKGHKLIVTALLYDIRFVKNYLQVLVRLEVSYTDET